MDQPVPPLAREEDAPPAYRVRPVVSSCDFWFSSSSLLTYSCLPVCVFCHCSRPKAGIAHALSRGLRGLRYRRRIRTDATYQKFEWSPQAGRVFRAEPGLGSGEAGEEAHLLR